MRYQVVITVNVIARNQEEAEREAMKAIVSDLAGWSAGVIEVRTEGLREVTARGTFPEAGGQPLEEDDQVREPSRG